MFGLAIGVVFAVIAAIFWIVSTQQTHALQGDGRLVTIYDRGTQQVLLSDEETIGDALTQAGIVVDSHDVVEPALTEKMVASEYEVNIYRARPVTIVDGHLKEKVMTAYQTAEQILDDSEISLNPEDDTQMLRSNDLVGNGAGLQLVIDRATAFSFDLYGSTTLARAQGATVGEMLKEKGITLGSTDRVAPSVETPLTEGLSVRLWREGKQTVTAEEAVAFSTEQIKDADRPVDYKEVQTAGKNGTRKVTYQIEIRDGQVVSRTEIASLVIVEPIKQVEIIGDKVEVIHGFSADKEAIMAAAGVPAGDMGYASYIIDNENAAWCAIRWQGTTGCWSAYREKFEGAETSDQVGYGLCQSTPAIKMESAGADWRTNAVTQMKWCQSYALGRYGSWQAAYNAKVQKGWW